MIKRLINIFFILHLFFPLITPSGTFFYFNETRDDAATNFNDVSCVPNSDCVNNFRDFLRIDMPEDQIDLVQSILQTLSDSSSDDESSEYKKNHITSDLSNVVNEDTPAVGSALVISNCMDDVDHETPTLGKRKIYQERDECEERVERVEDEPSRKYVRSDHKCRLVKRALAEDLKRLFIQQTGDHFKNYYHYEILNYPVDSSKRGTNLTLKEVESIRNVFGTLKFSKISADDSSKTLDHLRAFSDEKRYVLLENEARNIIHERYCKESGDTKALCINWELVDLSKIPDRFSETFEIIKSGRIFDFNYISIFEITEILDNIHFFKVDTKVLARKDVNPLIEARHILLEQYRKDMNLPTAKMINWERVQNISGLDGINYKMLKISGAREIIKRRDQIKFEPKINMKNLETEDEIVLIKARRILIEKYRKGLNLPTAKQICWSRVEKITGLGDGINFKTLTKSDALEIIEKRDQIRFEPKTNVVNTNDLLDQGLNISGFEGSTTAENDDFGGSEFDKYDELLFELESELLGRRKK